MPFRHNLALQNIPLTKQLFKRNAKLKLEMSLEVLNIICMSNTLHTKNDESNFIRPWRVKIQESRSSLFNTHLAYPWSIHVRVLMKPLVLFNPLPIEAWCWWTSFDNLKSHCLWNRAISKEKLCWASDLTLRQMNMHGMFKQEVWTLILVKKTAHLSMIVLKREITV